MNRFLSFIIERWLNAVLFSLILLIVSDYAEWRLSRFDIINLNRVYTFQNPFDFHYSECVFQKIIDTHSVSLFIRALHLPSSQHFGVDMSGITFWNFGSSTLFNFILVCLSVTDESCVSNYKPGTFDNYLLIILLLKCEIRISHCKL